MECLFLPVTVPSSEGPCLARLFHLVKPLSMLASHWGSERPPKTANNIANKQVSMKEHVQTWYVYIYPTLCMSDATMFFFFFKQTQISCAYEMHTITHYFGLVLIYACVLMVAQNPILLYWLAPRSFGSASGL